MHARPAPSLFARERETSRKATIYEKASKPTGAKKPAAKKPMQKQRSAIPANSKKAKDGTGLSEAVAQLAQSAEKLAQAAERLAEATARLSITAEARHEILETRGPSTADPTTSPQEFETAEVTDSQYRPASRFIRQNRVGSYSAS